MSIGTKSVLFGAHCFFVHPWFVAVAWWKLYGFPFDPRLWVAFFVHDLGYLGKPNIDGKEGEWHPMLGSNIMARLFDWPYTYWSKPIVEFCDRHWGIDPQGMSWSSFSLYHSRYLAKRLGHRYSPLCVADKLAIALTPWWIYLPLTTLTGEINEYLQKAQIPESDHWTPTGYNKRHWYRQLCRYMRQWADEHKTGKQDTWTNPDRHEHRRVSNG